MAFAIVVPENGKISDRKPSIHHSVFPTIEIMMTDEWKNAFNYENGRIKEAIEDSYQHLFVQRARVHPVGKSAN